jgi:hypothetical protein
MKSPPANQIDSLFANLTSHISSLKKLTMKNTTDSQLMEFKILYDMLSFLLHYHSKKISSQVVRNFKSQPIFQELRVFEEFVGLLGNTYQMNHMRIKEMFHLIKQSDDEERLVQQLPEAVKNCFINSYKYCADSNQNKKNLTFISTGK